MLLINCEINLLLTWSAYCAICKTDRATNLEIIDTKLYVPVLTLLNQDNTNLLDKLKSGFKRTSNWNKNQSKVSTQTQDKHLDYLIDPSFQGVNRPLVLWFADNTVRTRHTKYFLPKVEIKGYNFMINGCNVFNQPVKNEMRTYGNIRKIATGQGDHSSTGCLLDYAWFKEKNKLIAIDLSKQKVLNTDPK